jgi:hypothetical protein
MPESFLKVRRRARGRRFAATIAVVLAGAAVVVSPDVEARIIASTDTAHLSLIHASGAMLYERGHVAGTIPGSMRANLEIGASFSGSFTIYTSSGEIVGRGRAIPHGSGRYESFTGTMTITGGSGRYAHVRGTARLYGTFDRRTYAFVIQTAGKLDY